MKRKKRKKAVREFFAVLMISTICGLLTPQQDGIRVFLVIGIQAGQKAP